MKVLVAVDGSRHSEKALEFTRRLLPGELNEVTVVHVIAPDELLLTPDYAALGFGTVALPLRDYEEIRKEAEGLLARSAARLQGVGRVEPVLEQGDPAQRVLHQVHERQPDLVVVGSRGLGTLPGLLIGSVSRKVLQGAGCPVLVVR